MIGCLTFICGAFFQAWRLARPMARVDLHAHTNVSDGTLTPAELVNLAAKSGLTALAITDHDHVGALAAARAHAIDKGIEIVPGIELSVEEEGFELHLLGYLFDERDERLLATLDHLRVSRQGRAARIVERLQEMGLDITLEDVSKEVGAAAGQEASIGRPHIARALMAKGLVASVTEAFDIYLANGKPAVVAKEKLTAEQALALVHAAGGVAVLAHPVTIPEAHRETMVRRLAALGLDGLEVVHSKHGPIEREALAALADELGLIKTGGSDFHGANKPDVLLGTGRGGNVEVGPETLGALKKRKTERAR